MSVIEAAIGWLAPPQCLGCGGEGTALCEICSASEIIPYGVRCWRCGALSERSRTCGRCRHTGSPTYVWITTDYENKAKELVRLYKFGHLRAAAQPLAGLMTETFLAQSSDDQIQKANYLVVSIPTATSRIRQRGFDHAGLLASHVARNLKLPSQDVLGRVGQKRQVGTKRTDRLTQAQQSYYLRQTDAVKGRIILLVDDVLTTGGTICSVAKILRVAGAKRIDALIFAKRL